VAALNERSQYAARQARIGTLDIVNEIHRRSATLMAGLEQTDSTPDNAMIGRLEHQLQSTKAQIEQASQLRERLSSLVDACNNVTQEFGPTSG
jgi:predicted translin family RNA/ssDNA-binding protein